MANRPETTDEYPRFAAIDVGSNAVRLLLSRVIPNGRPVFKKEALFRIPVRLGEEAFRRGRISPALSERLVHTMIGFRHLIRACQPIDYMACATSAMRESANRHELVERIYRRSGIWLEVIGGRREAEIICSNHIEQQLDPSARYLYVDVGGGSTELSVYSGGEWTRSASFDIGTVRLLQGLVPADRWEKMKNWLDELTASSRPLEGIGSGGNINKIFRLNRIKDGKPIGYKTLKRTAKMLGHHSLRERIEKLGLKPDRADVIVPAARIYLRVLKWAGIERLYVPQIGLADGLIHILYEKHLLSEGTADRADPGSAVSISPS